jgi:hypothetical protein
MNPAMADASRQLLARSVTGATYQLVRGMRDGRATTAIRHLMDERRRLLAELARDMNAVEAVGSLTALRDAVAESDRTLEALIG